MKTRNWILAFGLLLAARSVHATWDTSTPAGTESKSLGDDRIREFKTDIQTALQKEGSFPGTDTANPHYIYTPSTGTTANRPTGNDAPVGRLYFNVSSNTIDMSQGNGSWRSLNTVGRDGIGPIELSVAVAGNALVGGDGTPLSVNADTNTFTITNDTLTIKANSIGTSQLAPAVSFPTSVNSTTFTWQNFGILPILQTLSFATTTSSNVTTSVFVNSSLSGTITPKLSTSKIFVLACGTGLQNAGDNGTFTLARGTTNLGAANGIAAVNASNADPFCMTTLDAPSTTSATTYWVRMKSNAASASTEFPYNASGGATQATMILVEIAQ